MTTCITTSALGWACLAVPGGHRANGCDRDTSLYSFWYLLEKAEGRQLRPVTTQVLGRPAQTLSTSPSLCISSPPQRVNCKTRGCTNEVQSA